MPIELRIQSGARAGQTESFDKPLIVVGRHPTSDLRFDVKQDLDVSTKHAEIRHVDGAYQVVDFQSTNGTFVNGQRLPSGGSHTIANGDTIGFGAHGPTVTVGLSGQTPAAATPQKRRQGTGERVAIAVKQQTRTLRIAIVGAIVVLGGIAAGAVWKERHDVAQVQAELVALQEANTNAANEFALKFKDDSGLTNSLKLRNDSLIAQARNAQGSDAKAAAKAALTSANAMQRTVSELDAPAIVDANNSAIVFINAEVGQPQEATGFCINERGLILTNRHVVQDSAGSGRATRIHVKFANSRQWRPAHVVKVGDGERIDIALIQLDPPARCPIVATIAATVDVPTGSAVATIGFPDGSSQPMDGVGNDAAAKTTLTLGTTSKSLADLLQLDSYASHGSSGSPVFDKHKHVIGVVWGGPPNSGGRIVYAVPAERIMELVKSVK